jgi:hypothetical protein
LENSFVVWFSNGPEFKCPIPVKIDHSKPDKFGIQIPTETSISPHFIEQQTLFIKKAQESFLRNQWYWGAEGDP